MMNSLNMPDSGLFPGMRSTRISWTRSAE